MTKELEIVREKLERIEKGVDRLDETVNRLDEMTKRMEEMNIDVSKCPHPYTECHLKYMSGSWRLMKYYYKKVGELYCADCPYVSPLFKKPIFLNLSRE